MLHNDFTPKDVLTSVNMTPIRTPTHVYAAGAPVIYRGNALAYYTHVDENVDGVYTSICLKSSNITYAQYVWWSVSTYDDAMKEII